MTLTKKVENQVRNGSVRLVLLITYGCCLRCEYCFVVKSNQCMPEEMLKESVDFLLSSSQKNLQFHFFGGEPLMVPFSIIKNTILYGEKKMRKSDKQIKFIITTNGIPLNKDKITFLKKHNVLLEVSLDGGPQSQNINRPQVGKRDSYSLIVKKLPLIFNSRIDVSCSMVISPQTVDKLVFNFNHLIRLGFKKVFMMMACGADWSEKSLISLKKNLAQLIKIYPPLLKKKEIILLNLRDWLSPFRMNTELAVNLDGYIYSACVTYLIHDEKVRKEFILGNIHKIDKNIDELEKKRLSNRRAMNIIYRELKINHLLPNNIQAGKIMAEFSNNLRRKILKDRNLWQIYESRI